MRLSGTLVAYPSHIRRTDIARPTIIACTKRLGPLMENRVPGLRYVSDHEPGFRRLRCGSGFKYVTASGRPLRSSRALDRLNSLAISPAGEDGWLESLA